MTEQEIVRRIAVDLMGWQWDDLFDRWRDPVTHYGAYDGPFDPFTDDRAWCAMIDRFVLEGFDIDLSTHGPPAERYWSMNYGGVDFGTDPAAARRRAGVLAIARALGIETEEKG